jgi:hypothetical protein
MWLVRRTSEYQLESEPYKYGRTPYRPRMQLFSWRARAIALWTQPSMQGIALLIGAAAIAIAASSATISTALLLSDFNNTKFKDKDLKEDLPYYFIPRLYLALPYN